MVHGLHVSYPFDLPNSNLKQQWSHIGVFICYQNIDAKKKKLNLHIYGIHLLNPNKTVVSHLKDSAYYCYCAYVLRISRYSDFLLPMLPIIQGYFCAV